MGNVIHTFSVAGSEEMNNSFQKYTIRAGMHEAGFRVQTYQSPVLEFDAVFDESAIYEKQGQKEQEELNVLFGFSGRVSFQHVNNARFEWRWLDGDLQVFATARIDDKTVSMFAGCAKAHEPSRFRIEKKAMGFVFFMDNNPPVKIQGPNVDSNSFSYLLFPHFGKEQPAPHDVNISIRVCL